MSRIERLMTRGNVDTLSSAVVAGAELVKWQGTWLQSWGRHRSGSTESQPTTFEGYVNQIHRHSAVIAAAVETRSLLLSDIHFRFQDKETGELDQEPPEILEDPDVFMRRLETHNSYGGAGFMWPDRLQRTYVNVRPDEMEILALSRSNPRNALQAMDTRIVGFIHNPQGAPIEEFNQSDIISPRDMVFWAPRPNPLARFQGESWVTSVLVEALIDMKGNAYVEEFYANAATPNIILSMDKEVETDRVKAFSKLFRDEYEGVDNSHRTMVIGGGVSATVVGAHLAELETRELQGGFESRVAVASRVPSSVLGTREGNQGSALNATAYNMMRRLWTEGWFAPQVRSLCRAIAKTINVPEGKRLSYDPQLTLMLQEDAKDRAEIMSMNIASAGAAVQQGWHPDDAVKAVMSDNIRHLLGKHSGRVSVQLLPIDEAGEAGELLSKTPETKEDPEETND